MQNVNFFCLIHFYIVTGAIMHNKFFPFILFQFLVFEIRIEISFQRLTKLNKDDVNCGNTNEMKI